MSGQASVPPFAMSKDQAIHALREALLAVAPPYFSFPVPGGSYRQGERVFAYELYHQMRNRFGYQWYVHGEFRKGLSFIPGIESEKILIPDIVVHQSETLEKNLMAIEIKTDPNLSAHELLNDLKKLEFYTRPINFLPQGGLDFRIGVMLTINVDIDNIIRGGSASTKVNLRKLATATPRVAIWNIERPIPAQSSGEGALAPGCLKILRADWSGWSSL